MLYSNSCKNLAVALVPPLRKSKPALVARTTLSPGSADRLALPLLGVHATKMTGVAVVAQLLGTTETAMTAAVTTSVVVTATTEVVSKATAVPAVVPHRGNKLLNSRLPESKVATVVTQATAAMAHHLVWARLLACPKPVVLAWLRLLVSLAALTISFSSMLKHLLRRRPQERRLLRHLASSLHLHRHQARKVACAV